MPSPTSNPFQIYKLKKKATAPNIKPLGAIILFEAAEFPLSLGLALLAPSPVNPVEVGGPFHCA